METAGNPTQTQKQQPETRRARPKTYPAPHIGMTVLWRQDPASTPSTALVTAYGRRNRLTLHVLHLEASNFDRRDGVPFIEDPDIRKPHSDLSESGCWDYTDDVRRLFM